MNTLTIIPLSQPITASVSIPGSKSYTNRALFLAALTKHPVVIKNPLLSDDTQAMIDCLKMLGIKIFVSADRIEVVGSIDDIKEKNYDLDANISGITLRFLLALTTIIPGTQTIYGRAGLNKRPIKDLVDALRQLGAQIEYLEKEGFPPLKISSQKLSSTTITLNGEVSSQYLSALLMIAPLIGNVTIIINNKQISKPYIDMTLDTMKQFGVEILNNEYKKYIINGEKKYTAKEYIVEGDFSSAGYFFAIAVLTQSKITIKNLNPNSKQADKNLLSVLETMGNKVNYGINEITIKGSAIKAMEIDVTDFPDQAQTLAVLAAFADGETKLKGVQSLRVKETERVVALQNELKKMRIKTAATKSTLTIVGGEPKPATINTYGDHRMAMSFAIAGSQIAHIKINNPEVVSKTFPEFWEKLETIGIKTVSEKKSNIVLIGMRGSGKSTIGKLLAKKLNKKFFDLDTLLSQKENKKLPVLIKEKGWNYFRKKEALVANEMKNTTNAIISTGGGVILNKSNMDALQKNGLCIFLNAAPQVLAKRIGTNHKRPPLHKGYTTHEELTIVLEERKVLYNSYADIIINTDSLTEKAVITEILTKIKGEIL